MSTIDFLDREDNTQIQSNTVSTAPLTEADIVAVLREIYDPEIPNANIVDLGLIYGVLLEEGGRVQVNMTLTSPMCPVAQTFPGLIEDKIRALPQVTAAQVNLVWDPPWSPDNLSEATRLELGLL